MDWDSLKQRLDAALDAMAGSDATADPERDRLLMRERASQLARPPNLETAAEHQLEVLTFKLGCERYAIDTAYVYGIERHTSFTPLPSSSIHIVGVTNIRGEIVAVVEVGAVFEVARVAPLQDAQLVVLGKGSVAFGMLVDSVGEVCTLDLRSVRECAKQSEGAPLRGVTSETLILVDGEGLIGEPRLFLDETEGQ